MSEVLCSEFTTVSATMGDSFRKTARRLTRRLEIHHTPKHGSWLNVAEIELKALSVQCISGRIADLPTLVRQVEAWERERNGRAVGVDWQFKTPDARIKLKHLYPQIRG